MNFLRKLSTAALSMMLISTMAMPVLADGDDPETSGTGAENQGVTYVPVNGGNTVLKKYLVVPESANVPTVEFTYTIAPGEPKSADADSAEIKAGPTTAATTTDPAYPIIGTAEFKNTSPAYDSVQTGDTVVLQSEEKYAKYEININLSGVEFTEPGIYRYVITENDPEITGITCDANDKRYLDVFVRTKMEEGEVVVDGDGNPELEIYQYGLYNQAVDIPLTGTVEDSTIKSDGYTNTYTAYDLTIEKIVEGNGGSKDEYFKFTVDITNGGAGNVLAVNLEIADAVTSTNGINLETHTNSSTIELDENGEATVEYWLQDGQSIVINGLAEGTGFTVSEDDATLDKEGYTTTVETDNEDVAETNNDARSANSKEDGITADTYLGFTNTKEQVIPTGLIVRVAPYFLVIILAGAFYFSTKKTKGILG